MKLLLLFAILNLSFHNAFCIVTGSLRIGNGLSSFIRPVYADVNTCIINKAVATAYDPATQIIKWNVIVNPHRADIQNGTITDPMPTGVKYIDGSFSESSPLSGVVSQSVSTNEDQLVVEVGKLGTTSTSYTYETKVVDPSDTSYNTTDMPVTNKAVFNGKIIVSGKEKEIENDTTGATALISSEVIRKSGSFAYADTVEGVPYDNVITWNVVLNQNAMSEGFESHVLFTDTPGTAQTYIQNSLEVSDADGSVSLSADAVSYDGKTITVGLDDKAKGKTLTLSYKTVADADDIASFKTDSEIIFENKACLKRGPNIYDDVEVSGKVKIPNTFAAKSNEIKTEDGTHLAYKVNLNPNELDLDGVVVTDTLPLGLSLDFDSIKLGKADVDASGKLTATETSYALSDLDFGFTPADGNSGGSFSLTLPAGNQAYILTYQCDITEIHDSYENKFCLQGGGFEPGVGESTSSFEGSVLGGATSTRTAQLDIQKIDGVTGDPLDGIEFGMYREVAGEKTLVEQVSTDASGQAVFSGLAKNTDYTIEEITPLDGYSNPTIVFGDFAEMPLADYTFNTATPGTTEATIKNDPACADVAFTKVNDWGQALAGVDFGLFDITSPDTQIASATSDANGRVVFDDVHFGSYVLKETAQSLSNCDVNTIAYKVEISPDAKVSITELLSGKGLVDDEFVNEAWTVPVDIHMYEEEGDRPIAGIQFDILDSSGKILVSDITSQLGTIAFRLPAGQTFSIVERSDGRWPASAVMTLTTPTLDDKDETTESMSIPWPKTASQNVDMTAGDGGSQLSVDTKSALPSTGDSLGFLGAFASAIALLGLIMVFFIRLRTHKN